MKISKNKPYYGLFLPVLTVFILSVGGCSNSTDSGKDNSGGTKGEVIEKITKSIENSGGTISLSDGTSVVFPAGAVSKSTKITLSKIEPSSYFDGSGTQKVVVSCDGAESALGTSAEIITPLAAGMDESDSLRVFAGLIDDSGMVTVEKCSIRTVNGKLSAVVTVNHFSDWIIEWFTGKTPPTSTMLSIPYYSQGTSQYCWATSLQMVTQAADFDEDSEITDIIGKAGVDESGITDFAFRTSSAISDVVKNRTGVRPERMMWDYINCNQAKDYIKQQIGNCGRPVAFFNGPASHAIVFVGYEGNTFYMHDPANTENTSIGYKAITWQSIVEKVSRSDKLVTLVVPKASLDQSRSEITVNIMNGAFTFLKPKMFDTDKSGSFLFGWDYKNSNGYSFKDVLSGTSVNAVNGHSKEFNQAGDIEIVNSSQSSQDVSVWVDISSVSGGSTHFSFNKTLSVGPNTLAMFKMNDVPVDSFRYNGAEFTDYILSVTALVGGNIKDKESIRFNIDSEEIVLNAAAPSSGSPGTEIKLTGYGFGTTRGRGIIEFNGVKADKIISWTDNEIKVKVPDNATTGNIVITRDEVKSNGKIFTVSQDQVMTGSYDYSDDLITGHSEWQVRGRSLWTDFGAYDFFVYPYYDMDMNYPSSFTITYSVALKKKSVRHDNDDGSYRILYYSEPVMKPLTEQDDILFVEGNFTHDFSNTGNTIQADFTFNAWQQYFSIRVEYEIPYDIFTYNEKDELISSSPGQISENHRIISVTTHSYVRPSGKNAVNLAPFANETEKMLKMPSILKTK